MRESQCGQKLADTKAPSELFVSCLSADSIVSLQMAFRNLFTDAINVLMNLDDMLKNETLMFDI